MEDRSTCTSTQVITRGFEPLSESGIFVDTVTLWLVTTDQAMGCIYINVLMNGHYDWT